MIRPGLPRIGERIFVLGYDKFDIETQSETSEHLAARCELNANLTFGVIESLHLTQRDRVMAPFPSFTIRAEIKSGMSGAPVINEAGYVCGMVSSSPSWEPVATCALLGLPMGLAVDLLPQPGIAEHRALIFDLVRDGLIASDGSLEDVSLLPGTEGFDVLVIDREGQLASGSSSSAR